MLYQYIITAAVLAENLHSPNWLILDCRGQFLGGKQSYSEFIEGHIPNAHYCSFSESYSPNIEGKNASPYPVNVHHQTMLDSIIECGFDVSTQIVIYDNDCNSFTNAFWLQLRSLGCPNVAVLQGGLENWVEQGFTLTTNDVPINRTA